VILDLDGNVNITDRGLDKLINLEGLSLYENRCITSRAIVKRQGIPFYDENNMIFKIKKLTLFNFQLSKISNSYIAKICTCDKDYMKRKNFKHRILWQ